MICPKCGKENQPDASFCMKCGEKLSHEQNPYIYCPSCGQKNNADENFCTKCMERLKSTNQPANYIEPKNALGFCMGLFFGIIGLIIGICIYPFGSVSRKTFVSSWGFGFFVWICLTISIVGIVFISSLHYR